MSKIVQLLRSSRPQPPEDGTSPNEMNARGIRGLQDSFISGMKKLIPSYLESLNQNGVHMPLIGILEIEMPKRIDAEVKMYLVDQQSVPESTLIPCSTSEIRILMSECLSCAPEPELAFDGLPLAPR